MLLIAILTWFLSPQGVVDWKDELRDDGQEFLWSGLDHVDNPLDCEEPVWIVNLPEAVDEDGEINVVVELSHIAAPKHLVPSCAVVDLDWKVAAGVILPEDSGLNGALLVSSSSGHLGRLKLGGPNCANRWGGHGSLGC